MDTLTQAKAVYDEDEQAWLLKQAAALAAGRLADLDRIQLSEYLLDMTARNRRNLRSRFIILLAHVIKCQFQPNRISRSWALTILVQQREINAILQDNPSLRQFADDELHSFAADAYKQALLETGASTADTPPVSLPANLHSLLTVSYEPVEHPMLPLFRTKKARKR